MGIRLDTGPSDKLADFVMKEEVPWTFCHDIDSPARLECDDDRVINLPLEKLSGDDQTYIKKR